MPPPASVSPVLGREEVTGAGTMHSGNLSFLYSVLSSIYLVPLTLVEYILTKSHVEVLTLAGEMAQQLRALAALQRS